MCKINQRRKLSLSQSAAFASRSRRNKLLPLIASAIVSLVIFQWYIATHHVDDLSGRDYFRSSFHSFIRRSYKSPAGRPRNVQKKEIGDGNDQQSNVILGRLHSTDDGIISNQNDIPKFFASVDEQHLHNGRVVRELSHRVLSRNIAQSNVMIVSPDFDKVHVFDAEGTRDFEPGLYPAKVAMEQGHTTHLIPSNVRFGDGWTTASSQSYNSTTVSWILLAYFATQSLGSTSGDTTPNIDEILSPTNEAVKSWLADTTITYIVFPIQATAKVPLSSILSDQEYAYEMDYIVDKHIDMIGLEAAKTLLASNYKLQLLSSSHYFDAKDDEAFYYGPNALFQNVKQLHRFLFQRATEILRAEVRHVRMHRHDSKSTNDDQLFEVQFHALIFATQGLDLAIPARSSYVDVGNHKVCKDDNGNRKKKCDPKLNPRAHNNTIFLECPKRHNSITVKFAHGGGYIYRRTDRVKRDTTLEKANDILVNLNDKWLVESDVETGEIEVWKGHQDASKAEALCIKADKSSLTPSVACTTRIVPSRGKVLPDAEHKQLMEKPNLLVVMIDPLSRQQMRRSLSSTWSLMDLMGFVDFPHYTAVGNNSGPNQAALYSGIPLDNGRDIRSSGNATERLWLWDRLKDAGYMTMKAEDGCISNSNMVQSINPQTHHGEQLREMFCFSYDRPNCLGGKPAAEHLIDYSLQFIRSYNRPKDAISTHARPWAAFVSFIDSHEDTSTLVSYLDTLLVSFLQEVIAMKSETIIIFVSDHGLHYGPTFGSDSGVAERAQPVLMMRSPTFGKDAGIDINIIKENSNAYVTPFDVHQTILHHLLDTPSNNDKNLGISLLKKLPYNERSTCSATKAIPAEYCPLIDETQTRHSDQCTFMRDPPSVLSFYSDLPKTNRPTWPETCPMRRKSSPAFTSSNEHCVEFQDSSYTLKSCGLHAEDHELKLDIHVMRNETLLAERKSISSEASHYMLPNIVFLEIDSVSLAYSERFFPKTWSLLQQHRVVTNSEKAKCPTGWCAAAFNYTSVVGQSSIVNQLAALSGCSNRKGPELSLFKPSTFCYSDSKNSTVEDHWIFDVARRLGYITFFGEEFCYEESPYVVQTQTAFKLNVDFAPHSLFCALAKESKRIHGKVNSDIPTWNIDYDTVKVPDSCFGGISRGEIGLSYITQMFEQYPDVPKFAFINALAAHDYSIDAAHMALGSESYDNTVYNFLNSIMSRNDERPTYIVLRSDHGLQGGPYPVDYSFQIEHMHPWTTFIVPAGSAKLSIDSLALNQDRLVTGFDLYNTMRHLMVPSTKSDLIGIPPWSYNLLQQTVPAERNCSEAKIPKEFCPCKEERDDMSASFYVGHLDQPNKYKELPQLKYDWKEQKFVSSKPNGILSPDLEMKYMVEQNDDIIRPMCNATITSYIDQQILQESWELVENITSLYPGSEVSGGIFLYPRQTILIAYLIQKEIASRQRSRNPKPFRICETGFGAGHSSALFLAASPHVEVVSFDLFNRPYQLPAAIALKSYFGNRLKTIIGDSCVNVKQFQKECDFLHGSSLCETDNIDLISKSGAGATLTSTAMDSLEDKSVYFGKRPKWAISQLGEDAQWSTLFKRGCIENITCFEEQVRTLDGNLRLARGKEQTISHKFCLAVSTGKCNSKTQQETKLSSWQKEDFCHEWKTTCPRLAGEAVTVCL